MLGWIKKLWPGNWRNKPAPTTEESDMNQHKLSHLTRGIQDAVQDAQAVAGQQLIHVLKAFFDPDGEKWIPKVVRVEVSPDQWLDIPLITLVTPRAYFLDEMTVDMAIRLLPDGLKDACVAGNSQAQRGSYKFEMVPSGRADEGSVRMTMKFSSQVPPEGIMRLIEDLTNTITPFKPGEATERSLVIDRKGSRASYSSSSTSNEEQPASSSSVDQQFVIDEQTDSGSSSSSEDVTD